MLANPHFEIHLSETHSQDKRLTVKYKAIITSVNLSMLCNFIKAYFDFQPAFVTDYLKYPLIRYLVNLQNSRGANFVK